MKCCYFHMRKFWGIDKWLVRDLDKFEFEMLMQKSTLHETNYFPEKAFLGSIY